MEIGEVRIRELNGRPVWMKRLGESFYLMNGVYCASDGTLDMESADVIESYLGWAADEIIPYRGADKGYTITFNLLATGEYCVSQDSLNMYANEVSVEDCEEALREYQAWTVLQG